MLLFTDQYSDQVVGMVMVDVSHPNLIEPFEEGAFGTERLNIAASSRQLEDIGDLGDLPLISEMLLGYNPQKYVEGHRIL